MATQGAPSQSSSSRIFFSTESAWDPTSPPPFLPASQIAFTCNGIGCEPSIHSRGSTLQSFAPTERYPVAPSPLDVWSKSKHIVEHTFIAMPGGSECVIEVAEEAEMDQAVKTTLARREWLELRLKRSQGSVQRWESPEEHIGTTRSM